MKSELKELGKNQLEELGSIQSQLSQLNDEMRRLNGNIERILAKLNWNF